MGTWETRKWSMPALFSVLFLAGCAFHFDQSNGWTNVTIKGSREWQNAAAAKLIVLDHWMEHNALYVN